MFWRNLIRRFILAASTLGVGLWLAPAAYAVPSFARQTGMACAACHTTFPELTEFGRMFKMNGYTMTGIEQISAAANGDVPQLKLNEIPPLSAMFMTSVTSLSKPQPNANAASNQNGSVEFPQQLSLFFAGEISPHMGTFSQITYTPGNNHFSMDNTDFRYADHYQVAGQDSIWGVTLNNNPTVEDVYQDTPAWGFPFISPDIKPTLPDIKPTLAPPATQVDGTLAQAVAGLGGYTFIADHYYADVTLYRSEEIGAGQPYNTGTSNINGLAPYWRLAFHNDFGHNESEVGYYGMEAYKNPVGSSVTNKYLDNAIDGYFEHFFNGDSLVFRGTYIHEKADYNGSYGLGNTDNSSDTLNTVRVNGEYHFGWTKSLALGVFRTSGNRDKVYGVDNNGNALSPDTAGWIAQAAYLPWQNVQLGLQYTAYDKYLGSSSNYDGSGRNASDNNMLYAYGWFMW